MPKKTELQLKKEKEAELIKKKYKGVKPVYGGVSPKPQPKPKATLEKEVVKVRTNGNTTTTQYPQRKTSSSDEKKVAVSELTKVTTRVPGKTKK